MDISFSQLILYFSIYSVLGWICETIWCSVGSGKLVNRGFLTGPWCPIYGFGALFILSFTKPLMGNPLIIFLVSMIIASLLEYVTGWILEVLFQTRWWDYSHRRFNLKGRVCLGNSLLFGLMGLIVTLRMHPLVGNIVNMLSPESQRVVASLTLAILVMDLTYTLNIISSLRGRVKEFRVLLQEMDQYQKQYAWYDRKDLISSIARLRTICEQDASNSEASLILEKIDEIEKLKGSTLRILEAFPKLQPKGLTLEMDTLKQEWELKYQHGKQEFIRRFNERKAHIKDIYKEITLTRIVWLFVFGSIIGYVVETIYCVITLGRLESRQGMLYGPFSQVYGFGAIVLALTLVPLIRKSNFHLFCGSAIAGGLFEVACSLVQEGFFNSVSWQYSEQAFSFFGGRTSLMYMFFWGILGVVYMRVIFPRIVGFGDGLSKKPKRFFTIAVAVLMILNMSVSALAVGRWAERIEGIEAENRLQQTLDERYPDEFLKEIYPNMVFLNEDEI